MRDERRTTVDGAMAFIRDINGVIAKMPNRGSPETEQFILHLYQSAWQTLSAAAALNYPSITRDGKNDGL